MNHDRIAVCLPGGIVVEGHVAFPVFFLFVDLAVPRWRMADMNHLPKLLPGIILSYFNVKTRITYLQHDNILTG